MAFQGRRNLTLFFVPLGRNRKMDLPARLRA